MKISKKEKARKKEAILETAVRMIADNGYEGVSMRKIAIEAKIGEATIYNYFSTKEKIVTFYFENRTSKVADILATIKGWELLSYREQLQILIDTYLQLFLPNREFIAEVFNRVFLSVSYYSKGVQAVRDGFIALVDDISSAAVEVGEIPEVAISPLALGLYWDYFIGVIYYWLEDSSDGFENSAAFADKSIDLFTAVLLSGIYDKTAELLSFFFRTHIVTSLDGIMSGLGGYAAYRKQPFGEKREREPVAKKRKRKNGSKKKPATRERK